MGCGNSTQITYEPEDKPKKATPEARVLRGQMYAQKGELEKALAELNAVIKLSPSTARAYLERGNVRMMRGQYELAIEDFSLAIKYQPNYLMAYVLRAQAYMQLRRFDEALADCSDAGRIDSDNAQVKTVKLSVLRALRAAAVVAARATSAGGSEDSDDPFAGLDSPVSASFQAQPKLCMVCMDNERGCRLRPCLHAALCVDCANELKRRQFGCPICASRVDDIEVGVFLSTFTVEEAQAVAGLRTGSASSGTFRPNSGSLRSGLSSRSRFMPATPTGGMPTLAEEAEADDDISRREPPVLAGPHIGVRPSVTVLPGELFDCDSPSHMSPVTELHVVAQRLGERDGSSDLGSASDASLGTPVVGDTRRREPSELGPRGMPERSRGASERELLSGRPLIMYNASDVNLEGRRRGGSLSRRDADGISRRDSEPDGGSSSGRRDHARDSASHHSRRDRAHDVESSNRADRGRDGSSTSMARTRSLDVANDTATIARSPTHAPRSPDLAHSSTRQHRGADNTHGDSPGSRPAGPLRSSSRRSAGSVGAHEPSIGMGTVLGVPAHPPFPEAGGTGVPLRSLLPGDGVLSTSDMNGLMVPRLAILPAAVST